MLFTTVCDFVQCTTENYTVLLTMYIRIQRQFITMFKLLYLVFCLCLPGLTDATLPAGYIVCAWCQKPGLKLFTLKSDTGSKVFCGELCFTQCRRASFKKNKVCDWCKHVRHTVNYVDFQDGEQQLQFCSDKCLNQYKMNIFCKETQEHLQLIQAPTDPAPSSAASVPTNDNQILITPELWMQNGGEEHGQPGEKRKCKPNVSEGNEDEDQDDSRMSPEIMITEKKPDLSKMTVKGENCREHTRTVERIMVAGNSEFSRRHLKVDPSSRERIRRVRSRDSTCTPLSVTTSPGSSQMSTPPSVTSNLTPPTMNGPLPAFPGAPMFGAFGPGMFAPPPYLYPHLMGGFPGGGFPPPAWMVPPPGHVPPPGPTPGPPTAQTPENQGRQTVVRVTPTTESGSNRSRTPQGLAGGPDPTSTTSSPATTSSAQAQPHQQAPQQVSPAKTIGPVPMPQPMCMLPGMPPGLPFPPPPGLHPGMLPPHPVPGVPPATLMVPYPVMFPVPVPIPIPVPIRSDKDLREFALIINSMTPNKSPRSSSVASGRPPTEVPKPLPSPTATSSTPCTGQKRKCQGADDEKENSESAANCDGSAMDKIACACCQQSDPSSSQGDRHCTRQETSRKAPNGLSVSDLDMHNISRSSLKTPVTDSECSFITSSSDIEDVAMDLSKDKSKTERSVHLDQNKNTMLSGGREPPAIVMVKTEAPPTPLIISPLQSVGGFLMPPRDHAYSSRRAMILDAPSVPRDRNKSPSPEKRLMLRNPNRDIVFAKRRCMRTRIKTK